METIKATPHHIYQILTKRPGRIVEFFYERHVPDNLWLGLSICTQEECDQHIIVDFLKKIPRCVHFVSLEPLLEDINLWRWIIPRLSDALIALGYQPSALPPKKATPDS